MKKKPLRYITAAAHGTSVMYEVKNAVWHMAEQGSGGVVIAVILGRDFKENTFKKSSS